MSISVNCHSGRGYKTQLSAPNIRQIPVSGDGTNADWRDGLLTRGGPSLRV